MVTPPNTTVFWLLSPKPGRVMRALERMPRVGMILPDTWRLSSPNPPQGTRILSSVLPGESFEPVGAYLSRALFVPVTGVRADGTTWGRWEQGSRVAQGPLAEVPRPIWWRRLPGMPPHLEAWQEWARKEELPVLPLWQGKTTPFRTITSLERRDLLVERSGTWYELTLVAAVK